MSTDAITIHVNSEVAQAYLSASEEDRRKMDFLAGFQLAEYLRSPEPLEKVIEDMSREAQSRGLTPKILESLLHD
jgi:hypothetical protein